jgi:hypothetical protein
MLGREQRRTKEPGKFCHRRDKNLTKQFSMETSGFTDKMAFVR